MKTEMRPAKHVPMKPYKVWGIVDNLGILRSAYTTRDQAREGLMSQEHIERIEMRKARKAAKRR